MNSPLSITAVIPAYNCEKYIDRAVESVLKQTVAVNEILVIDDGSTDGTADMAHSFGDKVTLIQQANAGVSAARNTGIKAAKGDWIAFLDADDEWLPDKIQRQCELLVRYPDLMWTTGNYQECLCEVNRMAPHTAVDYCKKLLDGKDYFDSYLKAVRLYQWGHTCCMLIKRQVFDRLGVFKTDICIAEDVDMWLRIGYRYPKVGFSPEPLSIYHLTVSNSLMTTKRDSMLYEQFIAGHIKLAEEEGVLDEFFPAAGVIMRRWIRGMLFEGRKEEIRSLLNRFPDLFSPLYRGLMKALTIFPGLTTAVLHLLSKISRTLHLRRRLTRPPVKQ